jgi:hypothetical protein
MLIGQHFVGMEASAEAAHLPRERERGVVVRTKIPYQTLMPSQVTAMAEAEAREILDRQTW